MATRQQVQSEREARREFVRDRQRMVITAAICLLIAAVVVSVLGILGIFKSSQEKATVTAAVNYGVAAPCPAEGAASLAPTGVTLRVLNGTDKSGLALAVSQALNIRGFVIQGTGDFDGSPAHTEIRFGKNAITQAYTVYQQFNDAVLRMDNRADKLVDVIIGADFNNLNTVNEVTPTGAKLTAIKGCLNPAKMTGLPAASSHTAVK